MLKQIKLRKLIENLDGHSDSRGQASNNETVMGLSSNKTRLDKMVNRLAKSFDALSMILVTKDKEELNDGRTPCILISAFPCTLVLPWK